MTPITGNTYPVKDQLRALGCKWDAARKCWMAPDEIAAKALALVSGQPALNSPPPADLGPVDIAAECKKHGRVAKGTKTVPFRRESTKGSNPVGELFWGKNGGQRDRYLTVRASKPYRMSRDYLEDMDLFQLRPGWYVDVDAVAVEPTAEEIANDPAVIKAKAEAKKNRRSVIVHAVQSASNAAGRDARAHTVDLAGAEKLWGESRLGGSETFYAIGSRLVYVVSSYDDGPCYWEHDDAALADEARTLKG